MAGNWRARNGVEGGGFGGFRDWGEGVWVDFLCGVVWGFSGEMGTVACRGFGEFE